MFLEKRVGTFRVLSFHEVGTFRKLKNVLAFFGKRVDKLQELALLRGPDLIEEVFEIFEHSCRYVSLFADFSRAF